MQERESLDFARTPLERLLARQDGTAHAWITERLMAGDDVALAAAPPPSEDDEESRGEVEVSG